MEKGHDHLYVKSREHAQESKMRSIAHMASRDTRFSTWRRRAREVPAPIGIPTRLLHCTAFHRRMFMATCTSIFLRT